ncbi:MAG: sigma factor-like helix-turn-helix DNA-binding protein, partial [Acidimicrobiia bacterium]
DAFFRREFRRVVALAYALSGSRLVAEDLAQEAFAAAARRWNVVGTYDRPGPWVRRAVANRSVSLLRRRSAELRALARLRPLRLHVQPMPADAAGVWHEVRRLPQRQAQVVALRYLEELSLREIGEILGIGAETARTHLRRAHDTLRSSLEVDEYRTEETTA